MPVHVYLCQIWSMSLLAVDDLPGSDENVVNLAHLSAVLRNRAGSGVGSGFLFPSYGFGSGSASGSSSGSLHNLRIY